jgi:cytochrome c553
MPLRTLRYAAWLLIALLPWAAHGAAVSQMEYDQVLRSRPDLVHGETLFRTCGACHGERGAGVSDGTVPAIAGQHFPIIVRQLVDFRYDKRWDLRMEHFTDEHHLSGAQDIADVAAFVSAMPVTRASDHGSGEFLRHGGEVYARLCRSCHGPAAEGDEHYPRLAGQHYEYLLRQMHDAVEGRRPNFPPDHVHLLERFELADLAGVADYLSRLGS